MQAHDPLFDSAQNQALLVVCARKTIRTAAFAGIIWGVINVGVGLAAVQVNPMNVGLVGLALIMLAAGLVALKRPSLHALLAEAIISVLLLCWNIGVAVLNLMAGQTENFHGHGLIFPAIAAIMFFKQYFKLGHLRDAIAGMDKRTVDEASGVCKQLFKRKLKESPDIAEAASKRARLRFMSDGVFCAQRNLARAFYMSAAHFRKSITDPNRKRVRVVVRHPLGKLTYAFDKKNSDKIKSWLNSAAPQAS
ncbi:MAG: hypothetical protein QOH39_2572 [Verrucomicrobiota bacterium]|jgi:hypothetical protein